MNINIMNMNIMIMIMIIMIMIIMIELYRYTDEFEFLSVLLHTYKMQQDLNTHEFH